MARIVSLLVFKGAELFGKAFDFLSFFFTFQNSWHKYCISGIQRRRVLRYQGNYNSDEEVGGKVKKRTVKHYGTNGSLQSSIIATLLSVIVYSHLI